MVFKDTDICPKLAPCQGLFTSSSFDILSSSLPWPAGCPALSWPGLPSALGFKPLRASFPSSKSFKAECVWKAFFGVDWGGGSEPDRNR